MSVLSRTSFKTTTGTAVAAYDDWRAEIQPKLLVDIERQRGEEPKLFIQFQREMKRDRAAYKIRAEQFGAALALFIQGLVGCGKERKIQRACHAINLIASPNTISLIEGRAPDMGGIKWCICNSSRGIEPVFYWRAREHDHFGNLYGGDSFLRLDPKPSEGNIMHGNSCYSGDLNQSIDGCARPAECDRIRFEGAGATLLVPFGLGDKIYKTILAAMRRGGR